MDCIVLTRFDIPDLSLRTKVDIDAAYFEHRRKVMEAITLPSLLNQTDQDWCWVILTDPNSTCDLSHLTDDPRIIIRPVGDVNRKNIIPIMSELQGEARVVSVRLDSDDALHRTFVERMKRLAADADDGTVICCVQGYEYDMRTGKTYEVPENRLSVHPWSVVAYVESPPCEGVYTTGNHSHVFERCPHVKDRFHGWLRVLHGANVGQSEANEEPADVDLDDYGAGTCKHTFASAP